MVDLHGFDAEQVEPAGPPAPIPAGKYVAIITDSEWRLTRSGTGHYLQFTFLIIEGEYTDRSLQARLNLHNPNPLAVRIARAELAAICRAVGVLSPRDSTELHNIPLVIHVACRTRADTGDVVNEIRGYSRRPSTSDDSKGTAPNTDPAPWSNTDPAPWRRGR